jgi:hypothetical protein
VPISFSIRLEYTSVQAISGRGVSMSQTTIVAPVSWVKAHASCSVHTVFKELAQGAKGDIEDAKSVTNPYSHATFSFAQMSNERFSVMRANNPILHATRSVDFEIRGDEIAVYSMGGADGNKELFTVGLTLNNEGQCKLKIKGRDEDLEQWQVRRKALELLFFGGS